MKVDEYTMYEVEVTVTKKFTIDLDFDDTTTELSVEEHAMNDLINNHSVKINKGDIDNVVIKDVYKK
jgi:hypothetical protein